MAALPEGGGTERSIQGLPAGSGAGRVGLLVCMLVRARLSL